jgi:hypothetical protein
MKEKRPVRMVATDHIGFHVSGWKSLMDRQRRRLVLKRPLGVHMITEGGFMGYSGGNLSMPRVVHKVMIVVGKVAVLEKKREMGKGMRKRTTGNVLIATPGISPSFSRTYHGSSLP